MNQEAKGPGLLEKLNRALGQVRAEYESDEELYARFAPPLYFNELLGMSPSFLVGGRGTGKTTTLRSMSFRGQERVTGSSDPDDWSAIGAYWKLEPNVVSVFRGKGIGEELWSQVFSHYLNLKLSSLVLDYASRIDKAHQQVNVEAHPLQLFVRSLSLEPCELLPDVRQSIDLALADVESKINGNISGLAKAQLSLPGRPLDYLFAALSGLKISQTRPFMFCLDEYENLEPYQQRLLNTLIKQVGVTPYTFKIGVRNTFSIDRETLVEEQPLQYPADFSTIDIVSDLKGESFDQFAATVVSQRLSLVTTEEVDLLDLLPALSLDAEARLLGANRLQDEFLHELSNDPRVSDREQEIARGLSPLEASLVLRWARSHDESPSDVLKFAVEHPKKWNVRVGNYGYALLFAIRENRVGERKYYAGWKLYCQLADGNIRYMIRLVYEALRTHVVAGGTLTSPVSVLDQTRAAARVGETTIRDLQGWSRQGAALTRLALGLGSIFGSLARDQALSTPEVNQFRIQYAGSETTAEVVENLVGEAIAQGILLGFDGDKNARSSGATREMDFQLHPVLAPYFTYSSRRKRRMTVSADDVMALTQRESAPATVRKILSSRGNPRDGHSEQLDLLDLS